MDFSIVITVVDGKVVFQVNPIGVPQNSLISWNNTTSQTHQIEIPSDNFITERILAGMSSRPDYAVAAADGTTIAYRCTLHDGESGTIEVVAPQDLPPC